MKCQGCGYSGFKRNELNDYHGDGVLLCGPCCDDQDLIDKHADCEEDEDETSDEDEEEIPDSQKEWPPDGKCWYR